MSLTHILSKVLEVKQRFKSEFSKPKFSVEKELLVPPLTTNPILVGIAFDYMLRFYIYCLQPKKTVASEWVAQVASARDLETLKKFDEVRMEAYERYQHYLKDGKLSDDLLIAVLKLSKVEIHYRHRFADEDLDVVFDEDIEDLKKLISHVSPMMFKAKDLVVLNPTFREGSKKIGGADADLLIDDTLIEIKTIKKLHFPRDHFDQLMGYYTLNEIYGIDGIQLKPTVNKIGVYFSRYAYLHTFEVSEILNEETYPEFKIWFGEFLSEVENRKKKAASKLSKRTI